MPGPIQEIDGFNFCTVDDAHSAVVFQTQLAQSCQGNKQVLGFPVYSSYRERNDHWIGLEQVQ